ncbi:MAG: histidinol-phosphate transaminase [Gammaproteobacteria bacterium]|nr:histidinol-phosphate transaminase [Gammaproteobacteria bacterium]
MSWLLDIARPDIRAIRPYEHAAWEPGLVRLHANELPWRQPADTSAAGLNHYPEPHPLALAARLAPLYGVAPACLLPARGSDEAIDLLVRAWCRAGSDSVLICPPTFGMYGVCARVQGAAVIEVPLLRESGYRLDVDRILAACVPAVKLVFLCTPNNPTGNSLAAADIQQLATALAGRALLVIDEAYADFAGAPSSATLLASHPGIVVLRTLSKAHALAGARCGVALADPEIIGLLRRIIQPYALTQLSIEAVEAALQPSALQRTRARIAGIVVERARVAAALTALPGIVRVWPSDANFLLVEFADAAAALARTHAAGLLVRDFRRAPGLERALRISIGSTEQNDRLLGSLA